MKHPPWETCARQPHAHLLGILFVPLLWILAVSLAVSLAVIERGDEVRKHWMKDAQKSEKCSMSINKQIHSLL